MEVERWRLRIVASLTGTPLWEAPSLILAASRVDGEFVRVLVKIVRRYGGLADG